MATSRFRTTAGPAVARASVAAALTSGLLLTAGQAANAETAQSLVTAPTISSTAVAAQSSITTFSPVLAPAGTDVLYPYAVYPTGPECLDAANELFNDGEITKYSCFPEKSGPYKGLYHLYTD